MKKPLADGWVQVYEPDGALRAEKVLPCGGKATVYNDPSDSGYYLLRHPYGGGHGYGAMGLAAATRRADELPLWKLPEAQR